MKIPFFGPKTRLKIYKIVIFESELPSWNFLSNF